MRIVPNIIFLSVRESDSLVFHGIKVIQRQAGAMGCYPTLALDTLDRRVTPHSNDRTHHLI
jgi:hypothetical protein